MSCVNLASGRPGRVAALTATPAGRGFDNGQGPRRWKSKPFPPLARAPCLRAGTGSYHGARDDRTAPGNRPGTADGAGERTGVLRELRELCLLGERYGLW